MENMHASIAFGKRHPISIGVFAVLMTMVLGTVVALMMGVTVPEIVKAQVVGPPCCTVPPVLPPVLPPVIPVVPVLPPILPPVLPPIMPPPLVPQCTLSATPDTLGVGGGTATLTWTSTNAISGSINNAVGNVTPIGGGTVSVTVPSTTHYTMTVMGVGGQVTCGATVTVPPPPVPDAPTCTLVATPSAIQIGGSSALTWTSANATSVSINQGINSVALNGSTSVSPLLTTTYTLTATGAGGTVTCPTTVTVTLLPPPLLPACTLTANPTTITAGNSSALTWSTTNAATFSIDTGINGVTPVSAGTRSVSPTVTTTYTGTATSATGATANCTATVTVTNTPPPTPPLCTLVANPSAIQTGSSSVLTWTTANANTFAVDQGIGLVAPTSGGTQSITPATTTTYTGTATGPGGTVTCAATVTVTPTPPVAQCVLTATPTSITKGNSSVLSWSGTNIVSVIIDQGIGAKGPTGTVSVNPETNTTYTGTFTTTTGQTLSCAATVEVTSTVCTSNCGGGGGGGSRSPRVVLSSLKTPGDQPLAFVYLSQVPYTGLDLGPLGTALYWLMLVLWSLAAAYLIFFNVLPVAYRKLGAFGGSVKDVLGQPAVAHAVHTPESHTSAVTPTFAPANVRGHAPAAHYEEAQPAEVAVPNQYQEHEGFRSYATGAALTIEDIVKGLAREAEAHPTASAHELRPDFMVASAEQNIPMHPTHKESRVEEAPAVFVQPVPAVVAHAAVPFNEDVRHFIEALIRGDRDSVFGTIRGITRTGGDSEAFLTHAVCALDDAYRSRMDGSVCHPDILSVTADCHPSFLERIVTSLTTAVDGSYSTGITGVKLALTRALAVVNG